VTSTKQMLHLRKCPSWYEPSLCLRKPCLAASSASLRTQASHRQPLGLVHLPSASPPAPCTCVSVHARLCLGVEGTSVTVSFGQWEGCMEGGRETVRGQEGHGAPTHTPVLVIIGHRVQAPQAPPDSTGFVPRVPLPRSSRDRTNASIPQSTTARKARQQSNSSTSPPDPGKSPTQS
jgi:hypothetical protein